MGQYLSVDIDAVGIKGDVLLFLSDDSSFHFYWHVCSLLLSLLKY